MTQATTHTLRRLTTRLAAPGPRTEVGTAGEQLRVLIVGGSAAGSDELIASVWATQRVRKVLYADSGPDALRLLHKGEVDLALIDVVRAVPDGIEVARALQAFAQLPAVIFVADEPSRAVEAFDVGAVDFLLRPVPLGRLAKSLGRVQPLAHVDSTAPTTPLPADVFGEHGRLHPSSVRWIGVRGDYSRVHTKTGSKLVGVPLGRLVDEWAWAGMVRIHRAYAVQLAAVTEVRKGAKGYLVVIDGVELPVSRRAFQRVKERLIQRSAAA